MVFFFFFNNFGNKKKSSERFSPFLCWKSSRLNRWSVQYFIFGSSFFAKKGRKINQTNPIYTKNVSYNIISYKLINSWLQNLQVNCLILLLNQQSFLRKIVFVSKPETKTLMVYASEDKKTWVLIEDKH